MSLRQPANSYPASSTAPRSEASPGSGSPVTATVPAATSTSTPGSLPISARTALAQWLHVIPVTAMERVDAIAMLTAAGLARDPG